MIEEQVIHLLIAFLVIAAMLRLKGHEYHTGKKGTTGYLLFTLFSGVILGMFAYRFAVSNQLTPLNPWSLGLFVSFAFIAVSVDLKIPWMLFLRYYLKKLKTSILESIFGLAELRYDSKVDIGFVKFAETKSGNACVVSIDALDDFVRFLKENKKAWTLEDAKLNAVPQLMLDYFLEQGILIKSSIKKDIQGTASIEKETFQIMNRKKAVPFIENKLTEFNERLCKIKKQICE